MKIHEVGAKSFPVDGRTDGAKLTVAFRNFANTPNKRGGGGEVGTTANTFCINLIRLKLQK